MGFKYSFDYKALGDKETYTKKGGLIHEMYGTALWFFLAGTIGSNLATFFPFDGAIVRGAAFGLSLLLTRSVFDGDFNAFATLRELTGGEADAAKSLMKIVMQIVGAFGGCWLFKCVLGLEFASIDDKATTTIMGLVGDFGNQWMAHFRLFMAFLFYFRFRHSFSQKDLPKFVFKTFFLGVIFMIAGESFLYAPNLVFAVPKENFVAAISGFWDHYLVYAIYGYVARYVAGVWQSFFTEFADLPQYSLSSEADN